MERPEHGVSGGNPVSVGAADAVKFLTDLVGVMEHRYRVDTHPVYVTGFSGGARMASQLAFDTSNTFAAVAPVSGLRRPSPCTPTRAVPIIAFHGTADPVNPYSGNGEPYWVYSVPQAAKDWALQDRCSPITISQPQGDVTLSRYQGCKVASAVKPCTLAGEGHE